MTSINLLDLYDGKLEQDKKTQGQDTLDAPASFTPKRRDKEPPKEEVGILGTMADIAKSAFSSPFKEIENVGQTVIDVADYVDKKVLGDKLVPNDVEIDLAYDPKTNAGKVVQTIGAFATGFAASTKFITAPMQGAKLVQGMKPLYQKTVQNLIAGGVTDFVTGDTTDQRLADVLLENPKLANPVFEMLASKEDDTAAEARVKNAIEGFAVGAAIDGAMKTFKIMRNVYNAGKGGVNTAAAMAAREAGAKELTEDAIKDNAHDFTVDVATKDYITEGAIAPTKAAPDTAAPIAGLAKATPDVVPLEGLTMTPQAAAQAKRKEASAAYSTNSMLNYGKFNEETRDAITAFDVPIRQAVGTDKMSMDKLAADTVLELSNITGDIFGRIDDLRTASTQAESLIKEGAYHTALIQHEIAPRLNRALQLVDDGVEGAVEDLGNLVGRSLEELVEVKKLYRTIGRTVKSFDINAYIKSEDADSLITKALNDPIEYAKETISSMSTSEVVAMARRVKTAHEIGGNVMEVMLDSLPTGNAMKKAGRVKSSPFSTFKKHWYASMLSSPKTQVRNLGGNSVKLLAMPIERAAYGMAKGTVEGYKEDGISGAAIGAVKGMKDGYYFLQGLQRNIGTAWNMSKVAFTNGTSILRGGNSKYAESLEPNNIFGYLSGFDLMKKSGGVADRASSGVLGLLSGADEFFAQLVYGAETHTKLMTSLNKSGVLNTLADKQTQKEFIENYLKENYDNMHREVMLANGTVVKGGAVYKESLDAANDATFQTELGDWGKGFTHFISKCPPAQLIFPFQKTPINLFKDAFWLRSPWGAIADIGKALNSNNPEEAYKAFGHLATATLLWTQFYSLVSDGRITGAGPKDQIKRTALQESGWRPYCLKTDGGYLNLSSFEPFGSGAMLLADIAEITQRGDVEAGDDTMIELGGAALNATLRFAMNRTYLQGIADLVGDANKDTAGSDYLVGLILSVIPNAFKDTAQMVDPTIYDARTLVDKAKARLAITDSLAPRTSWLTGSPIIYNHGGGMGAFNPYAMSEDNGTSVTTELSKARGMSNPQRKINGADLTEQEYSEYCRLHGTITIGGRTLYEALDDAINSKSYDAGRLNNPDLNDYELDERRNEILSDCVSLYRNKAKSIFLREHQDVVQRIAEIKAGYSPKTEDALSAIVNF
ncbi:MAG: hypothetical protein RR091_09265 [Cloacibacillus sp.]